MKNLKSLMLTTVTVTTAVLSACSTDLYDPKPTIDETIKEYSENWEKKFGNIDPEQDWNCASRATVNFTIDEDALASYKLQVLTGDPLHSDDARLIGSVDVKTDADGKATASLDIDCIKGSDMVYVARIDSRGCYAVKAAELVNGVINANFGYQEVSVPAKSRAAITEHDLPIVNCPYSESQVNEFIASAKELKDPNDMFVHRYSEYDNRNSNNISNLGPDDNKNYVIKTRWTANMFLEASNGMYGTSNNQPYYPRVGEYRIIIAKGGTLAIENQYDVRLGCDIIVANGGTLDVTNCKLQMQNQGRVIIMPGGRLIDNKSGQTQYDFQINADSNEALIYNGGDMNIKVMNINSATVYNAGTVKAETIYIANYNAVYSNAGKTYVSRISGNGSQGTINNNCYLFSDQEITCLYLNQGANSSVECENITVCEVTLREGSIVATNHLNNHSTTISNGGGGFYNKVTYCGNNQDAAVFSAVNLDYFNVGPADGSTFNISGNIWFEYDNIGSFADNKDYALKSIAAGTKNCLGVTRVGKANITIPAGECTGRGHENAKPTPDPVPEAQSWIIAAEDMGSTDDYDFNDVVIRITHVAGESTATVVGLAAGGTFQSKIWINNHDLGEIHQMIDPSAQLQGEMVMLNTGMGKDVGAGRAITISVPTNFSITYGSDIFKMATTMASGSVYESTSFITNNRGKGNAPQAIIVPGDWKWPLERTNIETAYPRFAQWSNASGANLDWYTQNNGQVRGL